MLGYIGLGQMGNAIARQLQQRQQLTVYDLSPSAVEAMATTGAHAAASIEDLARCCDVIFLCLPTSKIVRQVVFGKGGIAETARAGTLIVDQTSGDPAETRAMAQQLQAKNLTLIDAPVSGGPRRAEAGTLAIMVGAGTEPFKRVRPLLSRITSNVYHAGDVGAGNVAKLANNLLLGAQQLITLEAVGLAVKNGIAPEMICEIMMAGTGNNYYLSNLVSTHIVKGKLRYTGALGTLHKDVSLACQMADSSGVTLMLGTATKSILQHAVNELGSDISVNALALVVEKLTGTQFVPVPNDLD